MPDFVKHSNGDMDWSKLFMGLAVAIVFIMQQYHTIQVADLKASVVPRPEYESRQEQVMDKDLILMSIKELHEKIDKLDKK